MQVFYRKGSKEIDFIHTKDKVLPIEVKAGRKIDKEIKQSMLDFLNKFKVKEGLIITEDKEGEEQASWFGIKRKIRFVPLWKWLLLKKLKAYLK